MRGGLDNLYRGTSGEHAAAALLARYFTISKPEPDTGIDFVGTLKPPASSTVRFEFQVKAGRRFEFGGRHLATWADHLESCPVILLHLRSTSALSHQIGFMVLHDWVIQHPDWATNYGNSDSVTIRSGEFTPVDDSGANFERAIQAELARVERQPRSLWRTLHSWRLALGESDLFRHFGRLGEFEVPLAVKDEALARTIATTDFELYQFLRGLWRLPSRERERAATEPAIKAWLNEILRPLNGQRANLELSEFRKFARAMIAYDRNEPFSMPTYTAKEARAWRVFCLLYPESLRLLDRVLRHPSGWTEEERKATLVLTAILANAGDEVLAGRATMLLRSLGDQLDIPMVHGAREFDMVKAYLYNVAEAEGGPHVSRCRDFLLRNAGPGGELELLGQREYYEAGDDATRSAMLRKLQSPRPRDLNVRPLNELTLEYLDRAGLGRQRDS